MALFNNLPPIGSPAHPNACDYADDMRSDNLLSGALPHGFARLFLD